MKPPLLAVAALLLIGPAQAIAQSPGVTKLTDVVIYRDDTFYSTFPFVAPPQQPRPAGTVDDNTRN